MIEVTGLHYYPIKSCGGTETNEATMTPLGIEHDREWMVADAESGKFMSQRKDPRMALVLPRIEDDLLVVSAPDMDELEVPLSDPINGGTTEVEVWGAQILANRVGRRADDWFSSYLGKDAVFVHFSPDVERSVTDKFIHDGATNKTGFSDGASSLLTSMSSLRDLNERLDDSVPMDRFRPNIVVDGADLDPFDEDYWRELVIGEMRAFVVGACARCPIPDTDQSTGQREVGMGEVTRTLKSYRSGTDLVSPRQSKGHFFGQNVLHAVGFNAGDVIRVGDSVTVSYRDSDRNIRLAST